MPTIARFLAAALLSLGSAAVLAEPVAIADAYELHDVNDADALDAMAHCLGDGAGSAKDFIATHARPGDHTKSEIEARKGGAGAVVASGPFWACVAFSPEGFPAWPVEALAGAISVRGVDPSVQADWSRKVLAQVAHEGEGRGLIILSSGDGVQVSVIADEHKASLIHYVTRRIPKDEIDRTRFAAVIDDPKFAGMSTTRMGTPNDAGLPAVFALPDARLRKPLDGEYVRERADDSTARFDFAGTRWQFGAMEAVLELQADGQAVETNKINHQEHKTTGTWRVEGGVLHVALGGARFSLVLDGTRSLTGDGRRKLFPGEPNPDPAHGGDGDFRWTLTMKRA